MIILGMAINIISSLHADGIKQTKLIEVDTGQVIESADGGVDKLGASTL